MSDQQNKNCVECSSEIPISAVKCTNCSSYQDWRRHLGTFSSTLALPIAILAVVGAFWDQIAHVKSTFFPTLLPDTSVLVTDISLNSVSLLVTNRGSSTLVFDGPRCMLALPREITNLFEDNGTMRWPNPGEVFETVYVYFTGDLPTILASEKQASLTYFAPSLQPANIAIDERNEPVRSFCTLLFSDEFGNEVPPKAVLLAPPDLLLFDLKTTIERISYAPDQLDRRNSLLSEIAE
ncbi:hypothetical protein SLH49_09605 [Cognatiyoonia sp. IB215446]|uniref:hypothetical protein n=1 Tax=Cognatiyoonia sp. IB215446 TaxID=3097355 RepID=UPI002A0D60BE|nr:hypothetical protein [Cognatiyoonia sp. IB215446]MDX8348242.1 hypothetical protein [Cognatiyoonia sp. IB215446]